MPQVGAPAPPFTLPDHKGGTVSLADLARCWVVLWWYPMADTPG
jgi:peroxiredoxin Q/BCP